MNAWKKETWSPDGHRCEPGETRGDEIVFFGCHHCGRTWVLQHATGQWSSTDSSGQRSAEPIARRFHDLYEELAPTVGYETRDASRKPWADVPAQNKELMVAVVQRLLDEGTI
jgi:hypothetical protein